MWSILRHPLSTQYISPTTCHTRSYQLWLEDVSFLVYTIGITFIVLSEWLICDSFVCLQSVISKHDNQVLHEKDDVSLRGFLQIELEDETVVFLYSYWGELLIENEAILAVGLTVRLTFDRLKKWGGGFNLLYANAVVYFSV